MALLVLGWGSGLGRAGVVEIEGDISVHIRPETTAQIHGGPAGGPYEAGPFTGKEVLEIEFIACLCGENPITGSSAFEWDFTYDGISFRPEATGPGPVSYTYNESTVPWVVALRMTIAGTATIIIPEAVHVRNAPPVVQAGPNQTAKPKAIVSLAPATFTDLGTADTHVANIDWGDGSVTSGDVVATGGSGTVSGSHVYAAAGVFAVTVTVTDNDGDSDSDVLQVAVGDGSDTILSRGSVGDSYIRQRKPGTSFGGATTMEVKSLQTGDNSRALVIFDLSGIPSSSTIDSATLSLHVTAVPSNIRVYGVRRNTTPWSEPARKRGFGAPDIPAYERLVLDGLKHYGSKLPAAPGKARFILRESLLSHRRLRLLVVIAAAATIVLALGAAWYWNSDYEIQTTARRLVEQMNRASSYSGIGVDTTTTQGSVVEVREDFRYVAPSQIWSNQKTLVTQAGGTGKEFSGCTDSTVAVVSATLYERCNEDPSASGQWTTSAMKESMWGPQAHPWLRLDRVRKLEDGGKTLLGGRDTRMYTGVLDADGAGSQTTFFENEGTEIKLWVREEDGYLARFVMTSTIPGKGTRTIDYMCSDFGEIAPFSAADVTSQRDPSQVLSPDASKASSELAVEVPEVTSQVEVFSDYKVATVNGQDFKLDVAYTEVERNLGLSDRESLDRDRGMLFVFDTQESWAFWMKGVKIPLDAIWIDANGRIVDIQTMLPQPFVPDFALRRYGPQAAARYVLEINGGLAEKLGFQVGMEADLR